MEHPSNSLSSRTRLWCVPTGHAGMIEYAFHFSYRLPRISYESVCILYQPVYISPIPRDGLTKVLRRSRATLGTQPSSDVNLLG